MLAQHAAGLQERLPSSANDQTPAVDLMVVRAQHRGGKTRTQVRLQPARLDAAQPLELGCRRSRWNSNAKRSRSTSSRVSATASVPSSR